MSDITVYIGRDNKAWLALYQDGVIVPEDTNITANFIFGEWCVASTVLADPIAIVNKDGGRAVEMQLGLIEGLTVGQYTGYLTIFDETLTNGQAWTKHKVRVRTWPVC